MPWFNVDDGFSNSKPVLKIPRRYRCAAIGLWTLAGAWSAKELTDGFIPDHTIEEFAATVQLADWLVRADLWRKVEGGWQFEGWAKWQKTKERVLAYRAKEAEKKRGQRSGDKLAGSGSVSDLCPRGTETGVPEGHIGESQSCPAPPLPTPEPKPNLGNFGGEVTQVAATQPPPRCPKHLNHTDPPNCIPCRDARLANEAWHAGELDRRRAARAAAKARADNCPTCHGTNWIPDTDPAVKCDHQEAQHA